MNNLSLTIAISGFAICVNLIVIATILRGIEQALLARNAAMGPWPNRLPFLTQVSETPEEPEDLGPV